MTIPLSLLWLQGRQGNVVLIMRSLRHSWALVISMEEERNGCWEGSFLHIDTASPVLGNFPTDKWHICAKTLYWLSSIYLSRYIFDPTLPGCALGPDLHGLYHLDFLVLWFLLVLNRCTSRKQEGKRREKSGYLLWRVQFWQWLHFSINGHNSCRVSSLSLLWAHWLVLTLLPPLVPLCIWEVKPSHSC